MVDWTQPPAAPKGDRMKKDGPVQGTIHSAWLPKG
jgi:hypothetical protein